MELSLPSHNISPCPSNDHSLYTCTQVGTNGYFTFEEEFTEYVLFLFVGNTRDSLVAPFFSDIDISNGVGRIDYEIHTNNTSQSILSSVNSIINRQTQTGFNGRWLLVATWDDVPQFRENRDIVRYIFKNCSLLCLNIPYSACTEKYISGNISNRLCEIVCCFHIQMWKFEIL